MARVNYKARIIALTAVAGLLAQDIAIAAPETAVLIQTFLPARSLARQLGIRLSESTAMIEDSYSAAKGDKVVYLLQDAHTNPSGQFNAARALEQIFSQRKLEYVFLEGGTGDDSLSFLRPLAPKPERAAKTRSFVYKGLLSGAEYFDLATDMPVRLWGVEDAELYDRALLIYRDVASGRAKNIVMLGRLASAADFLKERDWGVAAQNLDRLILRERAGEISAAQVLSRLMTTARSIGVPLNAYPHLRQFEKISRKETAVDFERAMREWAAATTLLESRGQSRPELIPDTAPEADPSIQHARASLLRETLLGAKIARDNFPELFEYFDYAASAARLNTRSLLEERASLEEALWERLTPDAASRSLHRAIRAIDAFRALAGMQLTPQEYTREKQNPFFSNPAALMGYFNRRWLDLQTAYEKTLIWDDGFAIWLDRAKEFYELTLQRDERIVQKTLNKMDLEGQREAVLVAGGYHSPNLKRLFRERGISYVSLLPHVLYPTNHERYEKLLLAQNVSGAESDSVQITAAASTSSNTMNLRPYIQHADPMLIASAINPAAQDTAARMALSALERDVIKPLKVDADIPNYDLVQQRSIPYLTELVSELLKLANNDAAELSSRARAYMFLSDLFDPREDYLHLPEDWYANVNRQPLWKTWMDGERRIARISSKQELSNYFVSRIFQIYNDQTEADLMRQVAPKLRSIAPGSQKDRVTVKAPFRITLTHGNAADAPYRSFAPMVQWVVNMPMYFKLYGKKIEGFAATIERRPSEDSMIHYEYQAYDVMNRLGDSFIKAAPPTRISLDLNKIDSARVTKKTAYLRESVKLLSKLTGKTYQELVGEGESLYVNLASNLPVGTGLGGSTTMAAIIFKALLLSIGVPEDLLTEEEIAVIAMAIESRVGEMGGAQDGHLGSELKLLKYPAHASPLALQNASDLLPASVLKEFADLIESHGVLFWTQPHQSVKGLNPLVKGYFRRDPQSMAQFKRAVEISEQLVRRIQNRAEGGPPLTIGEVAKYTTLQTEVFDEQVPGFMNDETARIVKQLQQDGLIVGWQPMGAGFGGFVLFLLKHPEDRPRVRKYLNEKVGPLLTSAHFVGIGNETLRSQEYPAVPARRRPVSPARMAAQKTVISTKGMTQQEEIAVLEELEEKLKSELHVPGSQTFVKTYLFSDEHGAILKMDDAILKALKDTFPESFKDIERLDAHRPLEDQIGEIVNRIGGWAAIRNRIAFINGGDFMDRQDFTNGESGLAVFNRSKELVDLGLSVFVSGNHDQLVAMSTLGLHLPTYEGFRFYLDNSPSGRRRYLNVERDIYQRENLRPIEEIVREHNLQFRDPYEKLKFWSEKYAEYHQIRHQEQETRWSSVKNAIRDLLTPDQIKSFKGTPLEEPWNKLIGKNMEGTDIYTGVRAVGKMSAFWWRQLLQSLEIELNSGRITDPIIRGALERAVAETKIIIEVVEYDLREREANGQWWVRAIEALYSQNYYTAEWASWDWAVHEGWGDRLFAEINISRPDDNKVTLANYILDRQIQEMGAFFKNNFNLYDRNIYGTVLHALLPFDREGDPAVEGHSPPVNGQFRFSYYGVEYVGNGHAEANIPSVWIGMDRLENDIRRSNSETLSDAARAFNAIYHWYGDFTTRAKPRNLLALVNQAQVFENFFRLNGIYGPAWVGHNPLPDGLARNDAETLGTFTGPIMQALGAPFKHWLGSLDGGAAGKFGNAGLFQVIDPADKSTALRIFGYLPGERTLLENPPIFYWKKYKRDAHGNLPTPTFQSTGIEKKTYIRGLLGSIADRLSQLRSRGARMAANDEITLLAKQVALYGSQNGNYPGMTGEEAKVFVSILVHINTVLDYYRLTRDVRTLAKDLMVGFERLHSELHYMRPSPQAAWSQPEELPAGISALGDAIVRAVRAMDDNDVRIQTAILYDIVRKYEKLKSSGVPLTENEGRFFDVLGMLKGPLHEFVIENWPAKRFYAELTKRIQPLFVDILDYRTLNERRDEAESIAEEIPAPVIEAGDQLMKLIQSLRDSQSHPGARMASNIDQSIADLTTRIEKDYDKNTNQLGMVDEDVRVLKSILRTLKTALRRYDAGRDLYELRQSLTNAYDRFVDKLDYAPAEDRDPETDFPLLWSSSTVIGDLIVSTLVAIESKIPGDADPGARMARNPESLQKPAVVRRGPNSYRIVNRISNYFNFRRDSEPRRFSGRYLAAPTKKSAPVAYVRAPFKMPLLTRTELLASLGDEKTIAPVDAFETFVREINNSPNIAARLAQDSLVPLRLTPDTTALLVFRENKARQFIGIYAKLAEGKEEFLGQVSIKAPLAASERPVDKVGMSDIQRAIGELYRRYDQTWLPKSPAISVTTIDLSIFDTRDPKNLSEDPADFRTAMPLLIEEAKLAFQKSKGAVAFVVTGPEDLKRLVLNAPETQGLFYGSDKELPSKLRNAPAADLVNADHVKSRIKNADRRLVVAQPMRRTGGEVDLLAVRALIRLSIFAAGIDVNDLLGPEFLRFKAAVINLVGHNLSSKEVADYLRGDASPEEIVRRYAIPPLMRIPLEKLLSAMRMAARLAGQSA